MHDGLTGIIYRAEKRFLLIETGWFSHDRGLRTRDVGIVSGGWVTGMSPQQAISLSPQFCSQSLALARARPVKSPHISLLIQTFGLTTEEAARRIVQYGSERNP